MSISIQDDLHEYIRERAEKDHFGSISDYVRWLVHCDRKGKISTPGKEKAQTRVRSANESMMVGMFEEFLDHYYQR